MAPNRSLWVVPYRHDARRRIQISDAGRKDISKPVCGRVPWGRKPCGCATPYAGAGTLMDVAARTFDDYPLPRPQVRWLGLVFFILIHVIAIVGTPLYIYYRGITAPELALFFFYLGATGMATTIGYHRLFAHRTFETSAAIRFLLLFFGAATFEESALKWASQHRQHHLFTDTEHDPYGVNKGFWHAHIGWILFWRHRANYKNVNDLR